MRAARKKLKLNFPSLAQIAMGLGQRMEKSLNAAIAVVKAG